MDRPKLLWIDQLKKARGFDIDQPTVGDLEMGDDRQRQKRELQQGAGKRAAHRAHGSPQGGDCRADHFGRRAAHQAGNRQGELGCNLPVAGRDKAAAEPDQTVDRKRHVLVVCADDADIVTIVPDGRSQGASLQTKAFDKAATDIAIAPVPLQHAHL